jgi:glucose-6-phosphate 1-dehydrogenase
VDVLEGDQTLFVHADEVDASWRLFTPLLERRPPIVDYPAGSWGPSAADALLARTGENWAHWRPAERKEAPSGQLVSL